MKKNLIKKVFAVSLSIAMACSFLPTANPVTASAAAPYVSLKTTFKTLKVGQKYKMTLKNNTINWKIRKVETTNKPIATVYGKTTSYVMIKGKSEGRATIRVHLRTTERKRNNTKTLRCRVKVVPAEQQTEPVQTEATVTTQAQLTEALNNVNLTKINIKPAGAVNFTIPEGTHSNVELVVDAPQSDIENNATFKSIQIDNIKPETWTERGKNNTFTVRAQKANIVIAGTAVVNRITFATAGEGKVTLNGGTLNGVTLSAKVTLNITGTKAANTSSIPVEIDAAAADSAVTTDVPADIRTSVKISVVFEKNATGSTLTFTAPNITAAITNRTSAVIVVTRSNGTPITIPVHASNYQVSSGTSTTAPTTPTYPSGGGSTGGSGTSSVSKVPYTVPSTAFEVTSPSAVRVTRVTSGTSITTTTVKVSFAMEEGANIVSGAGIKYQIQVSDGTKVKATQWEKYTGPVNEYPLEILNANKDAEEVTVKVSFCYDKDTFVDKNGNKIYEYDGEAITRTVKATIIDRQ